MKVKVGIIGGTGLDKLDIFKYSSEKNIDTPYGKPSDALKEGKLDNVDCVLLARHGQHHSIPPSKVNYRANMWALKELGCTHVVVSTACGSLREEIKPGDLVILDQFIDRTTKRHLTYYDGEEGSPAGVLHIPMDTPFCSHTCKILADACQQLEYPFHKTGTMVTIEGPRFSTRAESLMFRQWGGDVINMTTVPEVVLANELGLCYAAIAMSTDYDCWKEGDLVDMERVMSTLRSNAEKVTNVMKTVVAQIALKDWSIILTEKKVKVYTHWRGMEAERKISHMSTKEKVSCNLFDVQ